MFELLPYFLFFKKGRALPFLRLDKQEADDSHHLSAGKDWNVQPNRHSCVCVCVFVCVRLEQCTHTNCTVCIKCEHVCVHMYKLIFYTRYCNHFVLYMQWVCFISIVPSAFIRLRKPWDRMLVYAGMVVDVVAGVWMYLYKRRKEKKIRS